MTAPDVARLVATLDADAPWLQAHRAAVQAIREAATGCGDVARTLEAARARLGPAAAGVPRFVAPGAEDDAQAYEQRIVRHGEVSTRSVLHDLCNGLVWFTAPALKQRIAALHAAEIDRLGPCAPRRGALRDMLTLLDENGALLQAPAALWDALLRRQWRQLFVTRRALWSQARLLLVGHALIEQLATAPRKPLCAHVLITPPACDPLAAALAMGPDDWAPPGGPKPCTPLPVLGVPGWWPANADPAFYEDTAVFRPPRDAAGADDTQAGRKPSIDR